MMEVPLEFTPANLPVIKGNRFPYGGDYSPEQWTEKDWHADIECFLKAKINVASVGIFSWASIEKSPGEFDFQWLDRSIDILFKNGISICLSTGTAAHPAWLSQSKPECLITTSDGKRMRHGRRINFCPNSYDYRDAAARYVTKIAERYANNPAIVAWHIGNEYGHGLRGSYCYCDQCSRAFRTWLQEKYGSLESVNEAWFTAFWGHTISAWEQIEAPSLLNDLNPAGPSVFGGKSVDYRRFQSSIHLASYRLEREILRAANPYIPATTNLMGAYQDLNYFDWAPHLDFISWDCYTPVEFDPAAPAFHHDLMRSLKPEKPFWIMEQAPIHESNNLGPRLRRPGLLRTQSMQAIARGAEAILFFQLRQGRSGCEKFCSAIVQQGRRTDTYTFKECADLGNRLEVQGDLLRQGFPQTRTAILFDWDAWWAYSHCSIHASKLDYLEECQRFHGALYDFNVVPNFTPVKGDLSAYDVLLLPLLYSFPSSFAEQMESFVHEGGTVIMGTFSGRADERDSLWSESVPGPLRRLFGLRLEEFEQLADSDEVRICSEQTKASWRARRIVELATCESAEAIATFVGGIVDGRPAITRRKYGKGSCYYIATSLDRSELREFMSETFGWLSFEKTKYLERVVRGEVNGGIREFLINHSDAPIPLSDIEPPYSNSSISTNLSSSHAAVPAKDMLIVEWNERHLS